jgi:hypothetical protein
LSNLFAFLPVFVLQHCFDDTKNDEIEQEKLKQSHTISISLVNYFYGIAQYHRFAVCV